MSYLARFPRISLRFILGYSRLLSPGGFAIADQFTGGAEPVAAVRDRAAMGLAEAESWGFRVSGCGKVASNLIKNSQIFRGIFGISNKRNSGLPYPHNRGL